MYTKEEIDKLEDTVLPIEIMGDLDDDEKKIKLFDILTSYQTKTFIGFKALPGNDKVQMDTYKLEELISNIGLIYAIMPLALQTYKDIIANEIG